MQFASSVATGTAREIAAFGSRGDGKSWAALWAMVMHAVEHHNAGYPLPTTWLGLRDTHANHKLTTKKSLLGAAWPRDAHWVMSDGDHVATFLLEGVPFVRLELVGADSPADAERVRTECHGVWCDEPAPAMDISNGISFELWGIANSSARLPTHAHVGMLTSNYCDSDHWAASRFVFDPQPGTLVFRIPPGERATPEYRAELERLYATRPDLARKLVRGEFGASLLGKPVAQGFSESLHVAPGRLVPRDGVPIWFGHDGGHGPATVIAQRIGGRILIYASLHTPGAGTRQHIANTVRPWLSEHAPWFAADGIIERHHRYDPSMNTGAQGDIDVNPIRVLQQLLPGHMQPGPVDWPGRQEPMLAALNTMIDGRPLIQMDRTGCASLIKACLGAWYYDTNILGDVKKLVPKKPNAPWADLGDAFCYLIAGMAPQRHAVPKKPRVARDVMAWDPFDYERQGSGQW